MSLTVSDAPADEGMWLFTNPPKRQLKERYGAGNYPTGPGSEHSKLQKYADRTRDR